jgi:hypothetical protein
MMRVDSTRPTAWSPAQSGWASSQSIWWLRACEKIAKAVFLLPDFEETRPLHEGNDRRRMLYSFLEKKLNILIYHIKRNELRGHWTQCGFPHHIMRERKPY